MPYGSIDASLAAVVTAPGVGVPATTGGKTLAQLRDELSLRMAGRDDADPDRLDGWINEAYVDLWSSLNLPEMRASISFVTVAAQPFYQLPAVVSTTVDLALLDTTIFQTQGGTRLRKIDLESYRRLHEVTDVPDSFFLYGQNVLVLWPAPDKVYTLGLDFVVQPAPLVADEDVPALRREWQEGVLLLARAKAFDALMEPDLAQLAMNSYVAFVRRRTDRGALEKEGMIAAARPVRNARQANRMRGYDPRDRGEF